MRSGDLPSLRVIIESKTSKNHFKLAELRRLSAECDAVAHEILVTKSSIGATFARLEDMSMALQAVNDAMEGEIQRSHAERSEIESINKVLKAETESHRLAVAQKREEIADIPNKAKAKEAEKATLLAKKKAMGEQLERKLEEVRQDLIARQATLPIVVTLTEELEREWVAHQRLLDGFQKKDARLNAMKRDLERTEVAIREISARWPVQGKVKRKKGFGELEYIFEEALIQNRQMTMDHVLLRDELAALEELKAGLKVAAGGVPQ
jgi:DNA repair exonuclease SbcCD ATPase subunit